MRKFFLSAIVFGALLAAPSVAAANDVSDRSAAIQLCRAEVSAQAGASEVRLDQVRVRPRLVRVDLDLWRNGSLQNVRCDVTRGDGELTIAAITPALQTVSATR